MRYCLSLRSGPSRGIVSSTINGSSCAHSGCMLGITPSAAKRSRSASSTSCAWAITGRRSRGPLVLTACSIASSAWRAAASPIAWMWIWNPSASTARAASARLSHTCMPWLCSEPQYGASSAPVSFSMTPSAKNLTVLAVSSGDATSCDSATRVGELLELSVEVAGVGVEAEVEPHVERVLPGGVEVGVDVGGLHPRVLHPGHTVRQVVVGGGAERRDADRRIALRHHLVHQVDGAPLAQRAQRRAVLAARNLAEHRVRGVGGDPCALQRNAVAPHGVVVPCPQHDGPVGHRGVEPARVEQSARSHAALVGGADDPLVVGMLGGESFHLGDDLVDRVASAAPAARPPRGHRAADGHVRRRTTASGSRRRGRPLRRPLPARARHRRGPAPLRRRPATHRWSAR